MLGVDELKYYLQLIKRECSLIDALFYLIKLKTMLFIQRSFILMLFICCTLSVKSQTVNPARPYSPFRINNGVVYISGQIAPASANGKPLDFEKEVTQVMTNISTILKDSGSSLPSVLNVVVYLKDINQYAAFNKIYSTYFKTPFPARSCVEVKDLAAGANIEISAIAAVDR